MSHNIWHETDDEFYISLETPIWCDEEVDGDVYCRLVRFLAHISDRVNISLDNVTVWFTKESKN